MARKETFEIGNIGPDSETNKALEQLSSLLYKNADAISTVQKVAQKNVKAKIDSSEIVEAGNAAEKTTNALETLQKQAAQTKIKNQDNLIKNLTNEKGELLSIEEALDNVNVAYSEYLDKLAKGASEKSLAKSEAAIARTANAYKALGGNLNDLDKKIQSIRKDYTSKHTATGWLFDVSNFKEAISIIDSLDTSKVEKAFDMSNMSNNSNVIEQVKYLENQVDTTFKNISNGSKTLSSKTTKDLISNFSAIQAYYKSIGKDIPKEWKAMMNSLDKEGVSKIGSSLIDNGYFKSVKGKSVFDLSASLKDGIAYWEEFIQKGKEAQKIITPKESNTADIDKKTDALKKEKKASDEASSASKKKTQNNKEEAQSNTEVEKTATKKNAAEKESKKTAEENLNTQKEKNQVSKENVKNSENEATALENVSKAEEKANQKKEQRRKQLEEETQATKDAIAVFDEYAIKNQKEKISDGSYSYTAINDKFQELKVSIRQSEEFGESMTHSLTTNFKALENAILSSDKAIKNFEIDIQANRVKGIDTSALENLKTQADNYRNTLLALRNEYIASGDYTPTQFQQQFFDTESARINADETSKIIQNAAKTIGTSIKSLDKILASDSINETFKQEVKDVRKEFTDLETVFKNNLSLDDTINAVDQLSRAVQRLNDVSNKQTNLENLIVGSDRIAKSADGIATFLANNTLVTSQTSEFRKELEKIKNEMYEVAKAGESMDAVHFNELITRAGVLQTEIKKTGDLGNSFFTSLRKQLRSSNAQLVAMYMSWMDIIRYAKQMFTTIRTLDTALVDLRKTTTMSDNELNEFYYTSNDVAKQLGVTTEEVINQASSWSRLNKIGPLYGNI